jgi:serine/threonine-protein kinase
MMFALISGRAVHTGPSNPAQMLAILTKPAPPLLSVAPEVPRAVAAVVDRALAFEREDRWQDAESMAEALRWCRRSTDSTRSTGLGDQRDRRRTNTEPLEFATPVRVVDEEDSNEEQTRVAALPSTRPPPAISTLPPSMEFEPTMAATAPTLHEDPTPHSDRWPRPQDSLAPVASPTPPASPAPPAPPASPAPPAPPKPLASTAPRLQARPRRFFDAPAVAGVIAGLVAGGLALGGIVAAERLHKKASAVSVVPVALTSTASIATPSQAQPVSPEPTAEAKTAVLEPTQPAQREAQEETSIPAGPAAHEDRAPSTSSTSTASTARRPVAGDAPPPQARSTDEAPAAPVPSDIPP